MAVTFQDYYETLGIPRDSTQSQVQSAYRKLARKYHPDINQKSDAEEKFKRINEAYEVLKDPEKRKKYDQLGENWQAGDDFSPPPGWENFRYSQRTGPGSQSTTHGFNFNFGDGGGFSDFFETLFGGLGGFGETRTGPGGTRRGFRSENMGQPGQDHEAELTISLEDAYRGGKKSVSLQVAETDAQGRSRETARTYQVNIPKGVTEGRRLRLSGQGSTGFGGARRGDLYFRIHIAPHPVFRIKGNDLETDVLLTPSEAALGATIRVPLVTGSAEIKIPPGIQSGKRIRLKGKGLGSTEEERGDVYAVIKITVPKRLSDEERRLYEELAQQSDFNPRTG